MNKLLKFKAVEVLRNNHKLAQLYVSFPIDYEFSHLWQVWMKQKNQGMKISTSKRKINESL